jgi:hypothetical protein
LRGFSKILRLVPPVRRSATPRACLAYRARRVGVNRGEAGWLVVRPKAEGGPEAEAGGHAPLPRRRRTSSAPSRRPLLSRPRAGAPSERPFTKMFTKKRSGERGKPPRIRRYQGRDSAACLALGVASRDAVEPQSVSLPLFTQVRGRRILRTTSPLSDFRKYASRIQHSPGPGKLVR